MMSVDEFCLFEYFVRKCEKQEGKTFEFSCMETVCF